MNILHDGEFLQLRREGHWEYVARQRSTGAGFIVAVTDQNELVMVEQHRIPMGRPVIELPAGLIGDSAESADESPEHSALRELEEETGYRASASTVLCSGPVAPGMTSEMSHFVHLTGLQKVGPGGGIDDENIRVHAVPVNQVDAWLEQRIGEGMLVDPRIFVALYFLNKTS